MITLAVSGAGFFPDKMGELAAMAGGAGIGEVELPARLPMTAESAREDRRILLDHGLSPAVCGVFLDFSQAGMRGMASLLKQAIVYTDALGARAVNLYSGSLAGVDGPAAGESLVSAVASAIGEAGRRDMFLTLENELSMTANVADTVDRWLGVAKAVSSPFFRLTIDLPNFVACGEPEVLEKLDPAWPFVGHVHLKDIVPYTDEKANSLPHRKVFQHGADRFLAVPVGDGIVDHGELAKKLVGAGYSGLATFECFFEPVSLKKSAECFRGLSGDAGG